MALNLKNGKHAEHSNDDGLIKTVKCKIKCFNKRLDKAKHVKEETTNGDEICSESTESLDLDTLRSGESLFKTFSFNPKENADTKRCIAFWNAVLEKKLQPIKVRLIENNKTKEKNSEDPSDRFSEQDEEDDDDEEIWVQMFKEVQDKKLEEMRKIQICAEQEAMKCKGAHNREEKTKQKGGTKSSPKYNTPRSINDSTSAIKRITSKNEMKAGEISDKNLTSKSKLTKRQPKTAQKTKRKKPERRKYSEELIWDFPEEAKSGTGCCSCGCKEADCECDKLEQIFANIISQKIEEIIKEHDCLCGCELDCMCEKADKPIPCPCGCGFDECICEDLEERPKHCSCGCGLADCICQNIIAMTGEGCNCGNSDCKCDEIKILGKQIEMWEDEKQMTLNKRKTMYESLRSSKVTTEVPAWPMEISEEAMHGTYCIICGLFNCRCNVISS